ncbi:hypothetical protein [uncultured Tessaracoccus sp.]|uniref:hypothetical protein n=1 Tax=uncultured Tessaracoccus sp. TaxID=905023 RepID=UPI0025D7C153|nr:hypothetical protein [uncultured Tessaracoccus sp.]
MSLPRMNPLASKMLGGADFRKQLRQILLDRAASTDDPAFRQRLESIANGRRPLRTLLMDPAFRKEIETLQQGTDRTPGSEIPEGSAEEVVHQLRARAGVEGHPIPDAEEAAAVYEDARMLADEAREVIRDEEAHGWGGTVERLQQEGRQERGEA